MSLALLIDRPDRVRKVWPTEPVLSRRDPVEIEKLLTIEEVEDWIDTGCLAMRHISIVSDGVPVDPRYYAGENEMPRAGYVRRYLDEGATLSIRSLERLKPSIARLYDALQRELGCPIHVNAYLTPGDTQGLHYHYDPYVTAILQVHGCKAWPLHRPFVKDPVREWGEFKVRRFTEEEKDYLANIAPDQTASLVPGDAFWLPRGYIHAPYTVGPEPSLHLTVAIKERTRHWFLQQLFEQITTAAVTDPLLRATVTPAGVLDDPEQYVEEMRNFAVGALITMDLPDAARAVQRATEAAPLC